jgi:hypothetical protein
VNLRHSRVASSSLAQIIVENVLDIVLIQEPFAKSHQTPSIINISPGYVAFHCLSQEHAYGAAILVKLSLAKSCRAIDRSRSNHIAAVDLHSAHGTFRFLSTYLRPSIKNIADQFSTDLSCLFIKLSIVLVDSNALSKVWNSKLTNNRGSELELLIANHFLRVLNRQLDDLDFIPAGTLFLDISLAGSAITCTRWFYPTIPSFSDHPYIYFEINRSPSSACGTAQAQSRASNATTHISRICLDKFRLKVADAVKNLLLQTNPTTSTIDDMIVKLSALISSAAKSSKDLTYIPVSSRSTPWWTKELWVLRHKSRQAFTLWSVQRTESNRQAFKAHKATYQREIRNAKLSSWNKLCDSQPSSSDLFSALKTKSGKSSNVSLPSSISFDGSVSSNPTDILKQCAEHFSPPPLHLRRHTHRLKFLRPPSHNHPRHSVYHPTLLQSRMRSFLMLSPL